MNCLLFPYPKTDKRQLDKLNQDIIFVPSIKINNQLSSNKTYVSSQQETLQVPCLFNSDYINQNDAILIYLHGNAEDILNSKNITDYLKRFLKINTLSVEYPGYSIYNKITPSQEQIEMDILNVHDYIVNTMKIKQEKIYVFGRSLGSGPATFLARNRQIGKLILMSAFTSIQDLIGNYLGRFIKKLIKNRFDNLQNIKFIQCPVLFIHGKNDRLINFKHSQQLYDECQSIEKDIQIKDAMSHSEFSFEQDMCIPIFEFIYNLDFTQIIILSQRNKIKQIEI